MSEDLNITAPQDAIDAEALDATLPDEARGHYATAEDADAAAALHTGHPPVWPHFIDG